MKNKKSDYAKSGNVLYPLEWHQEDIFKLERTLQKMEKLTKREESEEALLRG